MNTGIYMQTKRFKALYFQFRHADFLCDIEKTFVYLFKRVFNNKLNPVYFVLK